MELDKTFDEIKYELEENCRRLLKGQKLINKELWAANPWPRNEYFSLFIAPEINNVSEDELKKLSKVKIKGIKIEVIDDTGWGRKTVRASLSRWYKIHKRFKFIYDEKKISIIGRIFMIPKYNFINYIKDLFIIFSNNDTKYTRHVERKIFLNSMIADNNDYNFKIFNGNCDKNKIYYTSAGWEELFCDNQNIIIKEYYTNQNEIRIGRSHYDVLYKKKNIVIKFLTTAIVSSFIGALVSLLVGYILNKG